MHTEIHRKKTGSIWNCAFALRPIFITEKAFATMQTCRLGFYLFPSGGGGCPMVSIVAAENLDMKTRALKRGSRFTDASLHGHSFSAASTGGKQFIPLNNLHVTVLTSTPQLRDRSVNLLSHCTGNRLRPMRRLLDRRHLRHVR